MIMVNRNQVVAGWDSHPEYGFVEQAFFSGCGYYNYNGR